MITREGVFGTEVVVSLLDLESIFFLERVVEDLTSVPDEQLLELLCDDDGLVGSVLSAVEEPMGDAFELNEGFGTPLCGPISFDPCVDALAACVPF